MMGIVESILELNKSFHQALQVFPGEEAREEFIDQINQFLAKRAELINLLEGLQINQHNKKLGQEIIELNKQIDKLLDSFFKEIEADLRRVKQKKVTHNKYNEQSIAFDGMFFDKRK